MRSSINTNLLIFDEILDSSLDSSGVDDFIKLINALTNDENIFIISHKETIQDRFENTIYFEKVKNFSKIKVLN